MPYHASPLTGLRPGQEYHNRPTAPAHWWKSPDEHVLGGRDLLREEQGTWLGMTKQGRIAVLTNFREEGAISIEGKSRGAMVNAFLTQSPDSKQSTQSFVEDLVESGGLRGVGGFSLVCGRVGERLAVISNRSPDAKGITWIAQNKGETTGLSNAAFADRSWPKVTRGEELLASAISENVENAGSQVALQDHLFRVLSDDTLPKRLEGTKWDSYVKELRNSIFIPPIGGEGADNVSAEELATATSGPHLLVDDQTEKEKSIKGQSGVYGTHKQTVLMVDNQGRVTFVERTLFDESGQPPATAARDQRFTFSIDGWGNAANTSD